VTAIVQMHDMPISVTTEFADNADNNSLNWSCRIARAARRKGPNLGVPVGVVWGYRRRAELTLDTPNELLRECRGYDSLTVRQDNRGFQTLESIH
jgi:hypothetical protein